MFKAGKFAVPVAAAALAAVGIAGAAVFQPGLASAAGTITSAMIRDNTIGQIDVGAGGVSGHAKTPSSEVQTNSLNQLDIAAGGVSGSASVGEDEIQKGSIGTDDLAPDVLAGITGPAGADGKDGADGAPGADGKDGKDGSPGLSEIESDGPYPGATDLGSIPGQGDNSDETVPADGQRHTVWVKCADGKVALGGGFRLAADNTQAAAEAINVLASEPTGDAISGDPADSLLPTGWQVEVVNNGTTAQVVRPWVVCAKVAQ